MSAARWHTIASDVAAARIGAAVTAVGEAVAAGGASLEPARHASVRSMPAWVGAVALMESPGAWWLWCEPADRRAHSGQVALDVPEGRYLVDLLELSRSRWISRESAAGGLLVAGLATRGGPVLLRLRRVSASTSRPRD
jgi:hypothetical protein